MVWQDSMKFGGLQQVLPHRLAGPSLEEHTIRHDDGGAARGPEHGANVLRKVQLLVGGRHPEVLPVIGQVVCLFLTLPDSIAEKECASFHRATP